MIVKQGVILNNSSRIFRVIQKAFPIVTDIQAIKKNLSGAKYSLWSKMVNDQSPACRQTFG